MQNCSWSTERLAEKSQHSSAQRPASSSFDAEKACSDASISIINSMTQVVKARKILRDLNKDERRSLGHWYKMAAAENRRFDKTVHLLQQAHDCLTRGADIYREEQDEFRDIKQTLKSSSGNAQQPGNHCTNSSAPQPTDHDSHDPNYTTSFDSASSSPERAR